MTGPHAPTVSVAAAGSDTWLVTVAGRSVHRVTATPAVLARVRRRGEAPEATIARTFAFLLAREPASSILSRFALEDVARYFPEFWSEMAE